jgi:hypothetical protein
MVKPRELGYAPKDCVEEFLPFWIVAEDREGGRLSGFLAQPVGSFLHRVRAIGRHCLHGLSERDRKIQVSPVISYFEIRK